MIHETPARFIRESIFRCRTQAEFAAALGYEQATVSRWESGAIEMSREAMDRVRALAMAKDIAWDNNWFFSVPKSGNAAA